jgi:hypothetical protein
MKLRETFSRRHWWLYMFIGAFGAVSCWTTIPAIAQWPTQTSQTWYWCDPANTYYPNIARCPVPWRVINPTAASLPSSNSLAEQAADAQRRAEPLELPYKRKRRLPKPKRLGWKPSGSVRWPSHRRPPKLPRTTFAENHKRPENSSIASTNWTDRSHGKPLTSNTSSPFTPIMKR